MESQEVITVEVLAYTPQAFFHCQHCEVVGQLTGMTRNLRREQLASSLPDDLSEEYQKLSDWVREMRAAYSERITFRVIDAASIEGWFKSLRYGVHKYPAVILDRKQRVIGRDFSRASALIQERMAR